MKNNHLLIIVSIVIGLSAGILIKFFNEGKFIKIPNETHLGGIMGAIGVSMIIACFIAIGCFLIIWLLSYQRENKNKKSSS